jgi:dTDP-4-amino-4,6-dideoxygalactose transaminase
MVIMSLGAILIEFTKPAVSQNEIKYLLEAAKTNRPWGGGEFYSRAQEQLSEIFGEKRVLLTQSCTSALELAALALGISSGDEVIVPSYTFVSSAGAFALRGAKLVFADVDPLDLNITPSSIRKLITSRTKAIVVVHYGGNACQMDEIMAIAREAEIPVVEDAAQAIGATFNGVPLGSIGDLGCISFHGTKNISSGEGGALVVNTDHGDIWNAAKVAHEKGTDRHSYLKGEVDKYTWRALGLSCMPSEFTSAVLSGQLEELEKITQLRLSYMKRYWSDLGPQQSKKFSILNQTPMGNNGHMFACLLAPEIDRSRVISEMRSRGVVAASHYEPLHSSPYVLAKSSRPLRLPNTESASARILRLPMWSEYGLDVELSSSAFLESLDAVTS